MTSPQSRSSAQLVLSAIRSMMLAEVIAQPAAVTITVRRDMFTLLASALGEVMESIVILEESAATAERIGRELRIARADIERLELHLTARDLDRISPPSPYRPAVKSREERERIGAAKIVHLDEIFRRELRDAGRPTDGGAA